MSSAARAFSLLSSKIHPQLPLTPRESQQLLFLLTSSFRRHLDREHSRSTAVEASTKRPRLGRSSVHSSLPDNTLQSISSHVPTSRLLESILANPLLAHQPSAPVSCVQGFADNPTQWFRDRVADGSATIQMASLYAETARKASRGTSSGSPTSQRAGSEIAQWLWASGLETSTPFIQAHSFHASLAALLVQERNERPLWRWLGPEFHANLETAGASPLDIYQYHARLLKAIVLCKLTEGTLEHAISTHLYACSIGQPQRNTSMPARFPQYFSAGASIINHMTTNSENNSVSSSLYERFLDSTREWCNKPEGFVAMLHLQHPTRPALDPALQHLRHIADNFKDPKLLQRRLFLVHLSLALARGLLAEERFSEGLWVLNFVAEKFPQEVGWKAPPAGVAAEEHRKSISKDELENLQLLEALNI